VAGYKHIIGSVVNVRYRHNMTTGRIISYFPNGNWYEVLIKGVSGVVIYTGIELDSWN
jgi:hypothetical protein